MKTSVKIGIAIAYILAVLTSSCVGFNEKNVKLSGVTKVSTKEVSAFDKVDVSGAIDVIVNIGNKSEVVIEADSAIMPYVVTEVKDRELRIYNKDIIGFYNFKNNKIVVTITTPSILELESSGACDVTINDLKTDMFKVSLSGACDLIGSFECNVLDLEASGSSDSKLRGKVKNCNIELSGACDIKALDLEVDSLKIEGSGSSNVEITVQNSLEVELSGASELRYKGEPKYIKTDMSGVAQLTKVDNKK
ncbi:MAG: head GIN domain-containing protein [Bacteroidales bacterium]|nr:head GIN domain-containing protein [Bacteroidales bacterium]